MAKYLSVERLRKSNACSAGLEAFADKYGEAEVPVTAELLRAGEKKYYLDWLYTKVRHNCSPDALGKVNKAREKWLNTDRPRAEARAYKAYQLAKREAILEYANAD